MNRLDYYRAVLLGAVIGVVFISGFYVFTTEDEPPSPPDQKFAVVDTYKGCDVVQYTPTNAARYHYFLDCTEEMMNAMPYGGTSIKVRREKYD